MAKSADGLGICRECKHLQSSDYPEHIEIGSPHYYNAICLRSSDVFRICRAERLSLNKCNYFKSDKKSSFQTLSDLFKAFIISIKNDNWEPFKKAVRLELQSGLHRKENTPQS